VFAVTASKAVREKKLSSAEGDLGKSVARTIIQI
jgi:hypothetical protein